MKTYEITTAAGIHYVAASTRQAAVVKFCGMREKSALELGQILSIKLRAA